MPHISHPKCCCISQNLLVAKASAGAQKLLNIIKYTHQNFRKKKASFLSIPNIFSSVYIFWQHLGMMMSYDITAGGPMEAPIVELSVPVLTHTLN